LQGCGGVQRAKDHNTLMTGNKIARRRANLFAANSIFSKCWEVSNLGVDLKVGAAILARLVMEKLFCKQSHFLVIKSDAISSEQNIAGTWCTMISSSARGWKNSIF